MNRPARWHVWAILGQPFLDVIFAIARGKLGRKLQDGAPSHQSVRALMQVGGGPKFRDIIGPDRHIHAAARDKVRLVVVTCSSVISVRRRCRLPCALAKGLYFDPKVSGHIVTSLSLQNRFLSVLSSRRLKPGFSFTSFATAFATASDANVSDAKVFKVS